MANEVNSIRNLFAANLKYGIANETLNQKLILQDIETVHRDLIVLLLSNPLATSLFFEDVAGVKVLSQNKLIRVLFQMHDPMAGSFTAHPNTIGMFISDDERVALSFPYKDCILVGGMTKEDERQRVEVFYNEVLAKDRIDRLFEPKVLCNAVRYSLSDANNGDLSDTRNINKAPASAIQVGGAAELDGANAAQLADNLLIKGNNLIALHSLAARYQGAVDVCYIDPPYYFRDQKSSDTFSYNSNFKLSSWLTFMKNRLEIAKELLSKKGFIAISISEDGRSHLKLLCDDIFGESNFIGNITWESKTKSQNTTTARQQLQSKTESILLYKNFNGKPAFRLQKTGEREYPLADAKGDYRLKRIEEMSAIGMRGRETMVFPIQGLMPQEGKQWKVGSTEVARYTARSDVLLDNEKAYFKQRPEDEESDTFSPLWSHFFDKDVYGTAESGKAMLSELFGETSDFETVKPLPLIKKLIMHLDVSPSLLVMDFFGGSGTTGHAVMDLNKDDVGTRRFILVEQMDYADSLTAERLRRSMVKYGYSDSFVYVELMRDEFKDSLLACKTTGNVFGLIQQHFDRGLFDGVSTQAELLREMRLCAANLATPEATQALVRLIMEKYFDYNTEYQCVSDFVEHRKVLSKTDVALNASFYGLGGVK